jgi:hypothetical protein
MLDVHTTDREFIRELLSKQPDPKASLADQARFYRFRDMYVQEIEAEVGPALYEEDAIENDYEWIRSGC